MTYSLEVLTEAQSASFKLYIKWGFAKIDKNALEAKKWSIIAYLAKKLYLMPLK